MVFCIVTLYAEEVMPDLVKEEAPGFLKYHAYFSPSPLAATVTFADAPSFA